MAKQLRLFKDFSGGLSEVALDNMPNNTLRIAQNAVPGEGFGISRAFGTTKAYSAQIEGGAPVVLLVELALSAEETQVVAATEHQVGGLIKWKLHRWDSAAGAWAVVSDYIQPMRSWFVYAYKLFWLDGTSYRQYDGSTIKDVPNSNNQTAEFWAKVNSAVAVVQRSTRWFFATPENEIIVSEVGFYDKFVETNIVNVSSGLADTITALHEFNGGILAFQRRSVFYLTGYDFAGGSDVQLVKLNVTSGTAFPKTVKTVENAVLYLGSNGVYRLSVPYQSSAIAAESISENKVSKAILSFAPAAAYAEVERGEYYLALRRGAEVKEYRYNLMSGSWWGEYTQAPYCYALQLEGKDGLYLGCANGWVLVYDRSSTHYINTVTGGIASIPFKAQTKGFDVVGAMVQNAKTKKAYVVLRQYQQQSSNVTVQIKADYTTEARSTDVEGMKDVLTAVLRDVSGDESAVWDEFRWDQAQWGWVDVVTKMLDVNKKSNRIQFLFSDDGQDQPLTIYGVALLYKPKKAKGSRLGVVNREVQYEQQ